LLEGESVYAGKRRAECEVSIITFKEKTMSIRGEYLMRTLQLRQNSMSRSFLSDADALKIFTANAHRFFFEGDD